MRDMGTLQHVAYERLYGERLPEFRSDALVLRHKKSGAKICLVANDDENKTFAIGFRTPPKDSTGVAHIIEHSVLCGSQKYPLKDPFVELSKGSLNTYLNALTFPDKTVYPVASCNDKDFRNLVDVYMDAVLHPNIYQNELTFRQEGWRYHLEKEDDPITLNGVVYSEMKGAFSDPDDVFFTNHDCGLLPDTPYGFVSGGDPDCIPELSYEAFLDFHRKYYHPSNSFIYLYGNADMYDYLDYLDKEYLSAYDYLAVDSEIPDQKPLGIFEKHAEYALGEDEEEAENDYIGLGIVADAVDPVRTMGTRAVLYALLNMIGAPVKQALIDSGIAKDVYVSLDLFKQETICICAKGADVSRKDEFYEILFREMERIASEGISRTALMGFLKDKEFTMRESAVEGERRGLSLGMFIMDGWLHDESAAFRYCPKLTMFKKLRAFLDTDFYEQIIREKLLSHKHELRITVTGRKGLAEEQERKLAEKLQAYKESLSKEEIAKLIADTERLRVYQETPDTPETLAKIPLLQISDIRKDAKFYPVTESEVNGVPVLHYNTDTNGIVYMSLIIDTTDLPAEELPYLGLYSSALLRMDTKRHDYATLNEEIPLHVGDLCSSIDTYSDGNDYRKFMGYEAHHVKMLYEEIPAALGYLEEMIRETDFSDKKRLREVIQEDVSGMRSGMISSGNKLAKSCCLASFQPQEYYVQQTNGLGQYEFLYDVLNHFEEKADEVIRHMNGVMAFVLEKKRMKIAVTVDDEGFAKLCEYLPGFLEKLVPDQEACAPEPAKVLPWDGGYPLSGKNEAISFSGRVNYVAQAGNYKAHGFEPSGVLPVLARIISREYLYQNIRVKGGAYGASGAFTSFNGIFQVNTYRDPNLGRSYEVFKGIPEFVRNLDLSERELTKFVIGTVSVLDRPHSAKEAGAAAFNHYFLGITPEYLQKKWDEMLGVTVEKLRAQADLIEAALSKGHIACLGSESSIKKETALFDFVKTLR